jgi:EAL domain-containing protein (putative c-di-GMP-specific phosphodiesterase class I)
VPIGLWLLEQACRQAAAWRRNGHEIGVSVNVSGRQLELRRADRGRSRRA